MRILLVALLATACSTTSPRTPASAPSEIDRRIETFLDKSLPRLACNLSVGAPGSVIAAPEAKDPNYYYHWIRDSAIIVRSLSRFLPYEKGTPNEQAIRKFIEAFAVFSEKLQNAPTPYGLGETRFNIDGSVDSSTWPRPQYDGPGLRALALMDYLRRNGAPEPAKTQIRKVILRDLDGVAQLYNTHGYDLWEYANGFHFFTRMVQLRALEEGAEMFHHRAARWKPAARELASQLQTHWHPETGVITWAGPATDSNDHQIPIQYKDYDTSVSLAMVHGAPAGGFDDLDERVWSSLFRQESYFLRKFPFNATHQDGPAIGRDPGDNYYGGNTFFFLTSAYAEHSFRAAELLRSRPGETTASEFRLARMNHLTQRELSVGARVPNDELAQDFAREGNSFLETMLSVIPADGMMAEQMSKKDGSPLSARDLSWSYGSLLTAILERENWQRSSVDYSRLHFVCPDPSLAKPRE